MTAMLVEFCRTFIILGLILIVTGATLLALPLLLRFMPTLERLEKLPKILVYVYRYDNFYFITSPILIIAGLAYFAYLIWRFLR